MALQRLRTSWEDGGGCDAVAPHQLAQALFFAVAHFFRRIDHDGGEADSSRLLVGGKPGVGEEHFAVPPAGLALGGGPEADGSGTQQQSVSEHRKIASDRMSAKRLAIFDGEHLVGGMIGGENHALSVQSEDSGRAAFDQDLQLLFSFAPQHLLFADLGQVARWPAGGCA